MKTLCPISFFFYLDPERFAPTSSSTGDRGLVDRVKAFVSNFVNCTESRSQSANRLPNSSLANLSSITTPNGPWVYTVVPWED